MRFLFIFLLVLVTFGCFGQCQWDRFKKATDEATAEGKALSEAVDKDPSIIDDWERLDNAGIRNMEIGFMSAADKEKWLSDLKKGICRKGLNTEYVNPSGTKLKWKEPASRSEIDDKIIELKADPDPGYKVEGLTAEYLSKEGVELESVSLAIKRGSQDAGNIDIMTKNALIEVKSSFKSFTPGQVEKYVDPLHEAYFNPYGRKVILYFDKALTDAQFASIKARIPSDVIIVNSQEDLLMLLQ